MAKNREPEKPDLGSSEEEEEEEEGDDNDNSSEEEDDSEPEPESQIAKKSSSFTLKKTQPPLPQSQPKPPSSSEEESGSETDSDSEEPDPKSNAGVRKPTPKPAASEPATPSKSTAKRPAEEKELETKDAKKSKKADSATTESKSGDNSKKVLFQRLWSEGDEIVILKGMIDYMEKKKLSPITDLDDFLEFIKKKLHVEVNKGQLQDKIRRLKRKYENIKNTNRNVTKPHDLEAYALSSEIWGDEKGKGLMVATPKVANEGAGKKTPSKNKKGNAAENAKAENGVTSVDANGDVEKKSVAVKGVSSHGLNDDEGILKIGAELFGGANPGVEGAEEWRKLCFEEMELNLKKLDVKRAKMRLVLDVLKPTS